jgi:hypothetical protein
MKIYIEVLIVLFLVAMIIFWKLWEFVTTLIYSKTYKPQNDKSRKGGITNNGTATTTEPRANSEPISSSGYEQSKRYKLLPTTNSSYVGENSDSIGEDISSDRKNVKRGLVGFLRRRKK